MEQIKSNILNEAKAIRNIYNQAEITAYIEDILASKHIEHDNVITWIKRNLKNYILKDYENTRLIENLNDVTEDWAISGIHNKTLHRVVLDSEFKSKILHAIDFLQTEYRTKRLDTLSVPDAIKQSIEWTENQKTQEDDPLGKVEVMHWDDGFTIQEMTSKQALLYEGYKMKHCIGMIYASKVVKGQKRAFSLRDKNNNPHATIMFDVASKTIDEIKGVANHVLKLEYQDYIAEFLTYTDLSYSHIYQYEFLPNIHWDKKNQEFYVSQKKTHNQNVFYFETPYIHVFNENERKEYSSSVSFIRDQISLVKINKSLNQMNDIYFHYLHIRPENDAYELDALRKIKVNALSLELDSQSSRIETQARYVDIKLKNHLNNGHIQNLDLFHVKDLTISASGSFKIDTLNLKKAPIKRLHLKNVDINHIIFPETELEQIILDNVILPKVTLKSQNMIVSNGNLHAANIQANTLFVYDTKLNTPHTKVNQFLLSNTVQETLCVNQLTENYHVFNEPELIREYLSDCARDDFFDLVQAKHFSYIPSAKDLELAPNYAEMIETKSVLLCKEVYQADIEEVFNHFRTEFHVFKNIDYLDVPYLTDKKLSDDIIYNHFYFRANFLAFLEQEEGLMAQFYLFENLRCLNQSGVDLATFSNLLNVPVHPYMEKHINYIQKHPDYAMNDDFDIIAENSPNKKWKKIYSFVKNIFHDLATTHCLYPMIQAIDDKETKQLLSQISHRNRLLKQDEQAFDHFDKYCKDIMSLADKDLIYMSMNLTQIKELMEILFDSCENACGNNKILTHNDKYVQVWNKLMSSEFADCPLINKDVFYDVVFTNRYTSNNASSKLKK